MSISIPISGLNNYPVIKSFDFIPVVDSASLTTYRTPVNALGDWMENNGNSSSSFVSVSSSYSLSSSFSLKSISSSYSLKSTFSDTASSATYTPQFSLTSFSSSWSSASFTSTSASYAKSASVSITSVSSSYSLTSSFLNYPNTSTASYAISSSAAISSSYAVSSSNSILSSHSIFSDTASYFIPKAAGSGSGFSFINTGISYAISQPKTAFVSGSKLYAVNNSGEYGYITLFNIDLITNKVSFVSKWPNNSDGYITSTVHKNPFDGNLYAAFLGSQEFKILDFSTNTVTSYNGMSGYSGEIVASLVWTGVGSRPDDIYALRTIFGDSYGVYYYYRYHFIWNGASFVPSVVDNATYVNLNLANNISGEWNNLHRVGIGELPYANNSFIFALYNPIKKRHYIVDSAMNIISIFNHTTGDVTNSWLNASLTYEKSIAYPLPGGVQQYRNNRERASLDYDYTTGAEKGIVLVRSDDQYQGSVSYINWPEYGNS